jgi:DNA-binding response OmpR family regulator
MGGKMPHKGTILVIDDEQDLLETIRFRLEKEGYCVLTASDGDEGLRLLAENMPNLVIMDVMMPGMSGFEALERMKSDPKTKGIPVIIFSCGKEEESWALKSLKLGAAGYIVKPFDAESMLFTVEKFVSKNRGEK